MRTLSIKRNIFVKKTRKIISFWRSYSNSETFTGRNPFKKKTYSRVEESDSRNASRICISILGNGGIGQPRCIGLFTEFKSYLFNCGEGVGRYCREYGISTFLIKHVFITQRKWDNISGLADIFVSNQTLGVYNMYLYGPPGVESVMSLLSSKSLDTKITKRDGGYLDHTVNIDYVPIIIKKEAFSSRMKNKVVNIQHDTVYSYICKINEKAGDFLPEKCIEYGVPIGPDLLKLKNGGNIVLPCGKIVYAEDVHDLTYPERIILIVDCPSESFLESFIHEQKFKKYQKPSISSSPVIVFHFTPSHIFKSANYQNWMNRFHEGTQHFVLNSDNPIHSSTVVQQTGNYLNMLHPKMFGKLKEETLVPKENFMGYTIDSKLIHPPPMMQMFLRPKHEFDWCNVYKKNAAANVTVDGLDIGNPSNEFYDKLKKLKSALLKKSLLNMPNTVSNVHPEVVFFGTSSALSTAFRNVSAILVNTSDDNSILLDCGEGTMMQLIRYFGHDVYSVLQKISCIFISHKHTDHYLGLFEIISQRMKAFHCLGLPYEKVTVILPYEIQDIFMKFSEVFENLYPAVRIYKCSYLKKKRANLENLFHGLEIITVPVKHCYDAWGIVIESKPDWKIVYSGDTAPCQALVDAGKDCTLLIHEASIEDDLCNEAVAKRHSTPSQVIDIAEKMNAEYTIMTHFSKRYNCYPILPDCTSREISCAYDFMKVQKCDLPLLSLFTPVLKSLFIGHFVEKQMEHSNMVVNFEKIFSKVLKASN